MLGLSAKISEAEVHWREFLADLHKRGLRGVELLVSDDHEGLKAARRAVYPSVPWNRCQFHLSKNAQQYARRKEDKPRIAQAMRDIFDAPSREDAEELKDKVVKKFEKIAPEFVSWLEENVDEGLTVFDYPRSWWKRIRTINGLERLNRETRRRTRVVGIFPHEASALRLISAVLAEIHEEWLTGRQYLNLARLEKTSGAILPYRPSRKLQKKQLLNRSPARHPGRRRPRRSEPTRRAYAAWFILPCSSDKTGTLLITGSMVSRLLSFADSDLPPQPSPLSMLGARAHFR